MITKWNVIHERACFHQRVQKPGESVEWFIRTEQFCEFSASRNEHIRDRLVVRIRDKNLSMRMQLMAALTLETAVQMTRQAEDVANQISQQEGQATGSVQEVTSKQSSKAGHKPWMREKKSKKQ